MPRTRPARPDHAVTVARYAELEAYARAFADGHLNLLLVVGDPGLAKSRTARAALGDAACWIENRASAFGLYKALFEHRDRPVVIDDVDGLYADRDAVRLLKGLLQTEPVKTLSWHTQAADREGLPRRFETSSRALIIANTWKSADADVAALEDRGHSVAFEPTAPEVHLRAATWFWDAEVYGFVGERLGIIARPSLRDYVRGWELKRAGLPWRDVLLGRWLPGPGERLVAGLRADPSFATEAERVRAFIERGGGSRSSYYNLLKRLPASSPAPAVVLSGSPPVPPSPAIGPAGAGVLGLVEELFGPLGEG